MADKAAIKQFREKCVHDGEDYISKLREIERKMKSMGCAGMDDLKKMLEDETALSSDICLFQRNYTIIENIESVKRIRKFIDFCDRRFGKQAANRVWDKYVLNMLMEDIAGKYNMSNRWLFVIMDRYINAYLDSGEYKEAVL